MQSINTSLTARDLIEAELKKGRTITDIASEIDRSRSALSLFIAGKYPAKTTANLEAAIIATFCDDLLVCPFLARAISEEECAGFHDRPMPTHHANDLKHWMACQRCSVFAGNPASDRSRAGPATEGSCRPVGHEGGVKNAEGTERRASREAHTRSRAEGAGVSGKNSKEIKNVS